MSESTQALLAVIVLLSTAAVLSLAEERMKDWFRERRRTKS